jgi:mannose/fructose/N-acetylgalactosamine-specific phosphotransferase system component IIB
LEIVLLRVDSRLVHGQVIEAWVPFTGASSIVVVDNHTASDVLLREVMKMAVPPGIALHFATESEFIKRMRSGRLENEKVLVLCRDLAVAMEIVVNVPGVRKVNLGNLKAGPGKKRISPTVFLNEVEADLIKQIEDLGIEVEVKAVPTDMGVTIEY